MKKLLLSFGLLLLVISINSQTTVYWRTDGPSDGKWEWGTNCDVSNTDGQWYYNSWGGNRQRPDCYGNHDIYFNGNGINTMDLNSSNDFGVRRIYFTSLATTSRTLNTSASRTLWLNNNNGNPKIENNSTATHTFNVPVNINSNSELNPVSGNLIFSGSINNQGYWTDVWGSAGTSLTISGGMSGSGGLTIKNSTSVYMTSACTYTGNTYVNYGTLELSADNASATIVVASGATLRINGTDVDIQALTINSGGTVEVVAGKSLTVNGTLTNNGTLNLKSNSNDGTATLKALGTVTNGGATNYNVEQYLTGSRNWYISSPISSGTMPTAGYERDEVNAEWDAVSSGAAMSVGKGYIVQPGANTTITFAGTINNNEPTVSLSRTTGQTKAGFNLIGNPYPC